MANDLNVEAKMKKILILSYHFPPMNVIASQRALGYANHFKQFGFEPTILTFDWSKKIEEQYCSQGAFESKILIENHEDYQVVRIPVVRSFWGKLFGFCSRIRLSKIATLFSWSVGGIDSDFRHYDFRKAEWRFLKEKQESFDMALSISSPHFHARNLSKNFRRNGLPYILDYRDLWSNRILNKYYSPDFKMKLQDKLISFYWRKWAKNANLLTITSRPWADKLSEIVGKPVEVITNGFEPEEIRAIDRKTHEEPNVRIVHVGSLYNQQKLEIFLKGLRDFTEEAGKGKVHLYLIGARRNNTEQGKYSFDLNVESRVLKFLPQEAFTITDRVDRKEALNWLMNADLLLFPSFPDTPGTYSGKIFEYLMVKKPILMFPDDHDVCGELIRDTKTGVICNSPEEVKTFLMKFMTLGGQDISFDLSKIKFYSRESQTQRMAALIENRLAKMF